MSETAVKSNTFWQDKKAWLRAMRNTFWCILGCSSGNYGTLLLFQFYAPHVISWVPFVLGPIVGLITCLIIESTVLLPQMGLKRAIHTALGMCIISMLMAQFTANIINMLLVGSMHVAWYAVAPSLLIGYFSALVYNYRNLKKFGKCCH